MKLHKEAHIDPKRLMSLVTRTEGAQFTPAGVLRLPLDGASDAEKVLELVEAQLQQLEPTEPRLTEPRVTEPRVTEPRT